jgi:serine/threonine-protein kinase
MGSVWLARHLDLEVDVAVKLISWVQAMKPASVERFKREARAAAQLRSPHVVQIMDYGVHDGVPYIAMELLDGEDLGALLQRQGHLAPRRAADILHSVCKALALAHTAGIIHRDIKPGNVFLARVGDEEVVKILDFGIAKETQTDKQQTTGAALVGSPLYMSPEQIQGEQVDLRTDLWSVAVMAYEMLTGKPPFDAPALPELFWNICHGELTPPGSVSPDLASFDAFFGRALARARDARFGNARELIASFGASVAASPAAGEPARLAAAPPPAGTTARLAEVAETVAASMRGLGAAGQAAPKSAGAELGASLASSSAGTASAQSSPPRGAETLDPTTAGRAGRDRAFPTGSIEIPHASTQGKLVAGIAIGAAMAGIAGWILLRSDTEPSSTGLVASERPAASVSAAPTVAMATNAPAASPPSGADTAPPPVASATVSALAAAPTPAPTVRPVATATFAGPRPSARPSASAAAPPPSGTAQPSPTQDPMWGVEVSPDKR